ncbi:MAG: rifampicin phosphotransferase [Chloroflexota bacterium]|nr:rifampicin phosphotransferase [Chloroflexota bacterium]
MGTDLLALSDASVDLEQVGGKGLSLSKLVRAGLPVPDGFHITTAAYRRFVADNQLQPGILQALEGVGADQPQALEEAAARIAGLFAAGRIPEDLRIAIMERYRSLDGGRQAVAVRSSATAEDLPEASFAGQQETYLNVRGGEALLQAVKKCWASLWTARAIAYRLKKAIDQSEVALAVVVQELVDAQAAGILFTLNPLDGNMDEVVINAAWGLGEAVVGGLVSPDTITADKASGRITHYEVAEKTLRTVRTQSGTREKAIRGRKRKSRVLSDQQVSDLVALARTIEDFYGTSQNIEWAWAEQRFFILQSRPVTAAGSPDKPLQANWNLPDPKFNYMRSSLAEQLPNAATPLFGTLGLDAINDSVDELASSMDMRLSEAQYMYKVFNGYVYMTYKLTLAFTWEMVVVSIKNFSLMMSKGTQRWQAAHAEFSGVVANWDARDLATLSPSEILTGVYAMLYAAGKYYTVIQSGTLPAATTSEMIFTSLYKAVKRPDGPQASQLLLGLDSVALRAEKSLYDMAQWLGERPVLRSTLLEKPSQTVTGWLEKGNWPKTDNAADWEAFRERLQAHLHTYGRTAYGFDFANPSPAEMPELILDSLKAYLQGQAGNPYERQREADALRERTMSAILSRWHLIPRRWIRKLYEWTLRSAPVREDSLADLGLAHPTIRRYLNELGRRFAEQGALDSAEDIYWLYRDEVGELAHALEQDEDLPDLSAKVPERQALWQQYMQLRPPAVLPLDSPFAKMIPWARESENEHEIKGVGASAGRVTGTARVIFGPQDFGRMRAGDILVAPATSPAWTPLFTMAAGVVTDIGGPLSHSSIVAREYGIPAVLATSIGTRMIHDGQTITVDGDAGLVTLQE